MPETLPKIRDDLIIREVPQKDGSRQYIIKDPITSAYFQVREPEHFIISSFDGQKSPEQIAAAVNEKYSLQIEPLAISGFAEHLKNLCFLDDDISRQELLRRQKEIQETPPTLLSRLLFFRVKAFSPKGLLDFFVRHTGFFFTRGFIYTATLTIIGAFLISLYNAFDIGKGIAGLFNLEGLIIIYLCIPVVAFFHEMAHGLTCRHFGGEVREIGFLFIYFQPAFYCNVSDAWLFPEKRKRIWVSFSGALFQIFIWALAVIVWRITAEDNYINRILLAVMTFSGLATLFNFNPLLKYDGYYLLSDYLEIPNLRLKATRYWRGLLARLFLGDKSANTGVSRRLRRIYFYYGILAFIYVVFILGYFFILLGKFLVSQYDAVGFAIFAGLTIFLFRNVMSDAAKGLAAFFRRKKTFIVTLSILIVLVILSYLVKVELRVKGELVLQPMESLLLKYNSAGFAELVQYSADKTNAAGRRDVSTFSGDYTTSSLVPLPRQGDKIIRGQVIARMSNTETLRQLNDYSARLQKAEEELTILKKGARPEEIERVGNTIREFRAQLNSATQNLQRLNEMLGKGMIAKQEWEKAYTDSVVWDSRLQAARNERDLLMAGARPEEIKAKEAEISQLNSQIDFHTHQLALYEIKSPLDGVVLTVDTGEVVLEIGRLDTMHAQITLSERELADVETGQKVKFKVRSFPDRSFYGTVYLIDRKIIEDTEGRRVVRVFCHVPNEDNTLQPGMTGVANVYCGQRTIENLAYRKFFRTIRTEFWDWFDWF